MIDFAGAAVGAAFGELFKLVKHLVKTVKAFSGELKKIQDTLGEIEPTIEDIDKYNGQLNRGPEEMASIKDLLEEGKKLVGKCLRIRKYEKAAHSQKLIAFNTALKEKFTLYVSLLIARDGKELLVDVKEIGGGVKQIGGDVKEMMDMLTTVTGMLSSGAFRTGPGALGHLAVPAAPDFIVGSEVVESSRKLNKVGMSEAARGGLSETSTLGTETDEDAVVQVHPIGLSDIPTPNEPFQFTFDALRAATEDFSPENKLGSGTYADVFKGELPNGQLIAVKKYEDLPRQFENEVDLLAEVNHQNLVKLLGSCSEGEERLLVYEFAKNGSLDQILFNPERSGELDWPTRYQIALGIAQGMRYLHEESQHRIIHRDLKASHILLDSEMIPKISDFGLARIVGEWALHSREYMAPEYDDSGKMEILSMKSDVYSFGVLLLELVSGREYISFRQLEGEDIVIHAWEKLKASTAREMVDPAIGDAYPEDQVVSFLKTGLRCAQREPDRRPTMEAVLADLERHHGPAREDLVFGGTETPSGRVRIREESCQL